MPEEPGASVATHSGRNMKIDVKKRAAGSCLTNGSTLTCTETPSGVLPLPAFGKRSVFRAGVDYENTPVGDLVRRAQAGNEDAFREIVEHYQSKVFSIIHGI